MSLVQNKNPNAAVRRIEIVPDGDASLLVLHIAAAAKEDVLKTMRAQRETCTLEAQVTQQKESTLVYRTRASGQDILTLLRQPGDAFEEVRLRPKPNPNAILDMNRLRGILGTAGQLLQQYAGYMEKNPALTQASGISLASNLITVAYGTPQRINQPKTESMRHQADRVLARHLAQYQAPDEHVVLKERYKGSSLEKTNRFVGANNVYISDGMKFGSQMFLSGFGNNWVDRTMGTLQASAKVITFTGIDKDKDTPNHEKSWTIWFRENTNPFSGALEWAGQFMNMFNAVYLPQVHNVGFDQLKGEFTQSGIKAVKKHYRDVGEMFSATNWQNFKFSDIRILSPMRFAAVTLFLSGFLAKMFAPFSAKNVDWHELHHHAALALKQMPPEQLPHLMAELSQLYLKAVNDPNLTFGEVYVSLKADLEKTLPTTSEPKPVTGSHTAALMASRRETPAALAAHTAR